MLRVLLAGVKEHKTATCEQQGTSSVHSSASLFPESLGSKFQLPILTRLVMKQSEIHVNMNQKLPLFSNHMILISCRPVTPTKLPYHQVPPTTLPASLHLVSQLLPAPTVVVPCPRHHGGQALRRSRPGSRISTEVVMIFQFFNLFFDVVLSPKLGFLPHHMLTHPSAPSRLQVLQLASNERAGHPPRIRGAHFGPGGALAARVDL